ncbi:Secreted periplasmic Zn-dependent protease [Nitrosarchaeum koreense MY1]|uniref:Secreted periplasmic Zn-dependent protease n=1 Tax=Nitrosarchaeum koreense MY1 TaxID=1001994 RepID=F9CYF8_9ARCH|nr:Secreted periplasmic Zn-dependent protease [Nitrosarchaeum koreense MY1]
MSIFGLAAMLFIGIISLAIAESNEQLILDNTAQSVEIPKWIKDNAKNHSIQNNSKQDIISLLENLSNIGMIKNIAHIQMQIYDIPPKGKMDFVSISGNVNEHGRSGFVTLEIQKPDNTKEILRTPVLETGLYSTVFSINDQSQKGTYRVVSEFNGKQLFVSYFSIADNVNDSKRIPSWFVTTFHWWIDDKITDAEFIQNIQYLIDNKILIIFINSQATPELELSVDGQHLVRRGTTHTITSHITYGEKPVEGARVTLTIEDYDEDIIREFNGFSNNYGEFVFSWEIPKKYDDLETLLAYVSVTYEDSSVTKLFKFQVYCMPSESNCKIDGNR